MLVDVIPPENVSLDSNFEGRAKNIQLRKEVSLITG
jgi:hypothetical protein